jgi:hypothetical protein
MDEYAKRFHQGFTSMSLFRLDQECQRRREFQEQKTSARDDLDAAGEMI